MITRRIRLPKEIVYSVYFAVLLLSNVNEQAVMIAIIAPLTSIIFMQIYSVTTTTHLPVPRVQRVQRVKRVQNDNVDKAGCRRKSNSILISS